MSSIEAHPEDMDHEQRLLRAQGGDVQALEELFALYCGDVRRVARRIVGNDDEAQDVAQDTWMRVMTHVASLRDTERFAPWLRRVTRNVSLDLVSRRNRMAPVPLDDDESIDDFPASDAESPEASLLSHEVQWRVWEALGRLSEGDRAILQMREQEGLTYAEIAARLGITDGAAGVRVFRARDRFRTTYQAVDAAAPACGVPRMYAGSLIDGSLGQEARDRVESHLFACGDCRERFRAMRVGRAICRTLPILERFSGGDARLDGRVA